MMLRLVVVLLVALAPSIALSHKPSDSYLALSATDSSSRWEGQWDIALRDLDFALGLDADGDGQILWREVRSRSREIGDYALASLDVQAAGAKCGERVTSTRIDRHSDGAYVVLQLAFDCERGSGNIEVEYSLFAALDPSHRGLVRFEADGYRETSVLGGGAPRVAFEVGVPDAWRSFAGYAREGVWHIWIGLDHVLFVLCLLLPAVTTRVEGSESRAGAARRAIGRVATLITAFTLAHSLTLCLASLGLAEVPSRWVESLIAASVVVVALGNLFGIRRLDGPGLVFGFGLVHGLGFASVLGDLGLQGAGLAPALLGFNLGVELGQVAIVLGLGPLAFVFREAAGFRRVLLPAGFALIAAVALVWLAERSLGMKWLGSL